MRVDEPQQPRRFIFWWTAPFLVATLVLLPLLARPPATIGWIVIGAVDILCVCVLLGLYNPKRFWWCWRAVGAIVFASYLMYLVSTLLAGQLFGDMRRSAVSALNALIGLVVFGYPGLMYAIFGQFTWRDPRLHEDDFGDFRSEMLRD